MATGLTVSVSVRTRNRVLVLAIVQVLAAAERLHALPPAWVVGLGNRALQWFKVETRIGGGLWKPVPHGIKLELSV